MKVRIPSTGMRKWSNAEMPTQVCYCDHLKIQHNDYKGDTSCRWRRSPDGKLLVCPCAEFRPDPDGNLRGSRLLQGLPLRRPPKVERQKAMSAGKAKLAARRARRSR